MARTGRFGRLPATAPDLSSAIVSMVESWQNARDQNILEAWREGEKFEGKKVNDARIQAYYRKRRDSYDRSDPEWDQWDNDLWQIRFTISDQTMRMGYENGTVKPAEMAQHYRQWARKMPKNSSFYRTMMATAGQFTQAAEAGRQERKKQFNYERMQRRVDSVYKRDIKPAEDLFGAINAVAVSSGLIEQGQDVFSNLAALKGNDLTNILDKITSTGTLIGADGKDHWPELETYLDRFIPGWGEGSRDIGLDDLTRLARRAKEGLNEQNRIYRGAPSDFSSYIKGNNDSKKRYTAMTLLDDRLAADDLYEQSHEAWQEQQQDMSQSDPAGVLDPDKSYIDSLYQAKAMYLEAGDAGRAGQIENEIAGLRGEVERVNPALGLLWAETGGDQVNALQLAQGRLSLMNSLALLESGKAYIERGITNTDPAVTGMLTGTGMELGFSVQPMPLVNGNPTLQDPSLFLIPRRSQPGTTSVGNIKGFGYPEVVRGVPIYDAAGATGKIIGYKSMYDNHTMFSFVNPSTVPGEKPTYTFTTYDPFEAGNVMLTDNGAGGLVMTPLAATGTGTTLDANAIRDQVNAQSPASLRAALTDAPTPPAAGASEAEFDAYEAEVEVYEASREAFGQEEPPARQAVGGVEAPAQPQTQSGAEVAADDWAAIWQRINAGMDPRQAIDEVITRPGQKSQEDSLRSLAERQVRNAQGEGIPAGQAVPGKAPPPAVGETAPPLPEGYGEATTEDQRRLAEIDKQIEDAGKQSETSRMGAGYIENLRKERQGIADRIAASGSPNSARIAEIDELLTHSTERGAAAMGPGYWENLRKERATLEAQGPGGTTTGADRDRTRIGEIDRLITEAGQQSETSRMGTGYIANLRKERQELAQRISAAGAPPVAPAPGETAAPATPGAPGAAGTAQTMPTEPEKQSPAQYWLELTGRNPTDWRAQFQANLELLNGSPLASQSSTVAAIAYDDTVISQWAKEGDVVSIVRMIGMEPTTTAQNLNERAKEVDDALWLKNTTGAYNQAQKAFLNGDFVNAHAGIQQAQEDWDEHESARNNIYNSWIRQETVERRPVYAGSAFRVDPLMERAKQSAADLSAGRKPLAMPVADGVNIFGRIGSVMGVPARAPGAARIQTAKQEPTVSIPDLLKPNVGAPPRVASLPSLGGLPPPPSGAPGGSLPPPPPSAPSSSYGGLSRFSVASRLGRG